MNGRVVHLPFAVTPQKIVEPEDADIIVVEAADCVWTADLAECVFCHPAARGGANVRGVVGAVLWNEVPYSRPEPRLPSDSVTLGEILHASGKIMRRRGASRLPLARV